MTPVEVVVEVVGFGLDWAGTVGRTHGKEGWEAQLCPEGALGKLGALYLLIRAAPPRHTGSANPAPEPCASGCPLVEPPAQWGALAEVEGEEGPSLGALAGQVLEKSLQSRGDSGPRSEGGL